MNFSSPHNMMTTLLGQTRSSLVTLIKETFASLGQDEKLDDLLDENGIIELEQADLSAILGLLWRTWDDIKEKLFKCDRKSHYGQQYRSYLSLMMSARNHWAHEYTFSYEEVMHNCFVFQHFFRDTKTQVDTTVIDQIVDACFSEIIVDRFTAEEINDLLITRSEMEWVENEYQEWPLEIHKVEIIEKDVEIEKDIEKEKDQDFVEKGPEEQDDSLETVNLEEEETQIGPILSKQLDMLEMIIDKKDYKRLAGLMGFRNKPVVKDAYYPDTLYFAAEGPIWGAYRYEKLKLVEDHLTEVAKFAAYGVIPPTMQGNWEGVTLICLPNNTQTRVQFGRDKARMFCACIEYTSKWLEQYYKKP